MRPRVLILGLDGADDYSVGAAVRSGKMPNLTRLVRGKYHPLRSTPLPITPAAWTAAYTGYNPGRTGVLTFQRRVPNTYRGRIVNASDVGSYGFHTRLAEHGKTLVSIGFPMMSPPPDLSRGVIVSGWDSAPHLPLAGNPETSALLTELGYRIDDEFSSDPSVLANGIETRFTIFKRLLERYPDWDCAMLYLGFIDGLGHRLGFGNEATAQLLAKTDEELGRFVGALGDDVTFIVCSDHGFGNFSQTFSVMQWLEEHGYVTLRSRRFRSGAGGGIPGIELMDLEDGIIDWSNTRAFCWEAIGRHAAIALNVKGTYPGGIVSPRDAFALAGEIIEKLRATPDPATNAPIVVDARRREELFWGPHASEFPEIFIETASGTTAYIGKRTRVEGGYELENGIIHTGSFNSHHDDGIWGSSFDVSGELHVEDLAPTVYALLGIPVPQDCDGRNLSPAVASIGIGAFTVSEPTNTSEAYSSEEEELVRKRLEDLGYL